MHATCTIVLNYLKTKCSREIKKQEEINLKRYLKKYEKLKHKLLDDYTNENKTEHNENRPYIPDKPYRILITGGSGKTNVLFVKFNRKQTKH